MRKLLILILSAVMALGLSLATLVSPPAAHAGWTSSNGYNAGGWATVRMDFYTTKINAGSWQLTSVRLCMTPGNVNVTQLKNSRIQVTGSGGNALRFIDFGDGPGRNDCKTVSVPATNLGSGAYGTINSTVNINGWVPYPDYGYSFCRVVVSGGNC